MKFQPSDVLTITLSDMEINPEFAKERSNAQKEEYDIETLFTVRRASYPYNEELWKNNEDLSFIE